MDKLRLETLAVRVVAWHNRHPLARRIKVQHVQSIGYVALPFRVAGAAGQGHPAAVLLVDEVASGASLRERAMARARQPAAAPEPAAAAPVASAAERRLEAAFSEDILDPIHPPRVARWVMAHGRDLAAAPTDAPVRQVAATGTGGTVKLYALTALIETAGRRSRVLVGPGDQPPILGLRMWSLPRLLAAAAGALVLAATVWLLVSLLGGAPPKAKVQAAEPMATAPVVMPRQAVAASMPAPPVFAASLAAGPARAASAPASTPAVGAPPDVEPRLGRVALPALNLPRGDDARNEARVQRQALAASAAPLPIKPAAPEPAAAKPAPPAASRPPERSAAMVAAATPGTPTFAVTTRLLRTRAESEQVMVAMQALLATTGARAVRVEIVPNGDDWRVVGWPFARRDEAERARALLVSRGMRVEVLDF